MNICNNLLKSSVSLYMKKKNNYNYNELIECANGKLFGPGNAKLPLPPMLMFNRITKISENEGIFNKGCVEAELDINPNLWFFGASIYLYGLYKISIVFLSSGCSY